MHRRRYTPRYTGLGKQFIEQAAGKNLLKVILTPALRELIRRDFKCTDEEIDMGVEAGIQEFGDDFKRLLAEQRAMLTPPKENDDEPATP